MGKITFEEIENILIDSLCDPKKKKTLPYYWWKIKFNLHSFSSTRILLKHLAFHLEKELLKREYENDKEICK
jgi:hypothetical protein